jgi:hypothetical protein
MVPHSFRWAGPLSKATGPGCMGADAEFQCTKPADRPGLRVGRGPVAPCRSRSEKIPAPWMRQSQATRCGGIRAWGPGLESCAAAGGNSTRSGRCRPTAPGKAEAPNEDVAIAAKGNRLLCRCPVRRRPGGARHPGVVQAGGARSGRPAVIALPPRGAGPDRSDAGCTVLSCDLERTWRTWTVTGSDESGWGPGPREVAQDRAPRFGRTGLGPNGHKGMEGTPTYGEENQ